MLEKAEIPQQINKKMKIFMFGPAGQGKTLAALQFPKSIIVDGEKGTDQYAKLMQEKEIKRIQTTSFDTLVEIVHDLKTKKHNCTTLIIDPITIFWEDLQEKWHNKFVYVQEQKKKNDLLEDFGMRYWQKVKPEHKRFLKDLLELDMNVIVTAHEKDKYGTNQSIIGVTFDSNKSDDHAFDFVFRLFTSGSDFVAQTYKQRILPGEKRFPSYPEMFAWNYENLLKFCNKKMLEGDFISENNVNTIEKNNESKITEYDEDFYSTDMMIDKENNQTTSSPLIEEEKEEVLLIDKLKNKLKEAKITQKDFKEFINRVVLWDIASLKALSDKNIKLLFENWDDKIIPKFNDFIKSKEDNFQSNDSNESLEDKQQDNTYEDNNQKQEENKEHQESNVNVNVNVNGKITNGQISMIKGKLMLAGITTNKFLKGFSLENFDSITFDGANNIIKHFDNIIEELK